MISTRMYAHAHLRKRRTGREPDGAAEGERELGYGGHGAGWDSVTQALQIYILAATARDRPRTLSPMYMSALFQCSISN